jgi:hypothetical protein
VVKIFTLCSLYETSHEKPQRKYPVIRPGFEPGNYKFLCDLDCITLLGSTKTRASLRDISCVAEQSFKLTNTRGWKMYSRSWC